MALKACHFVSDTPIFRHGGKEQRSAGQRLKVGLLARSVPLDNEENGIFENQGCRKKPDTFTAIA